MNNKVRNNDYRRPRAAEPKATPQDLEEGPLHSTALVESAEGTTLEVDLLKRWGPQHNSKFLTRVPFSLVNPKRGGPFLLVNPKSLKPLLKVLPPYVWDPILPLLGFGGMHSKESSLNRHALLGYNSLFFVWCTRVVGFIGVWHPFTRAACTKVYIHYISLLVFI